MGIELLGKTNIKFIGLRKYAFILSAIFVSIGLIALIQIWRGQANLGIDFAGGTALQLKFEKPLQMEQARKALEGFIAFFGPSTIFAATCLGFIATLFL